jgi:threonine synthase
LTILPGIGPVSDEAIVDYRDLLGPFSNIEEIQNVSGIVPALLIKSKRSLTFKVEMILIKRYEKFIDLPEHSKIVSLEEGATPLIPLPRLAALLGKNVELSAKFEGLNPTGSFKDRGMTAAVSEAFGRGAKQVICASTGNTAASAAAYAARAGMQSIVLIPSGKVATGKLAGALAYGAKVIQIDGSFDEALTLVMQISEKNNIALVNSVNPFRLQGQKTAAFEICEEIDSAPDLLCLPVGNAGNITSYWMGFQEWHAQHNSGLPQLLGVQAAGAAPLVLGHPIALPETAATAIRIGKPARGEQALAAASESGGHIMACTDEEIFGMQGMLASEGIWVEPASAAGAAGLLKEVRSGNLSIDGKKVVVVCTGHGLKDPDAITSQPLNIPSIQANLASLEELIS